MRHTAMMQGVEERKGKPIEEVLRDGLEGMTMEALAEDLGISKAALGYWMLKTGVRLQRVVTCPGEQIVIRRVPGRTDALPIIRETVPVVRAEVSGG